MPLIDIVGRVYGRLTVLSLHGCIKRRPHWRCRCVCGKEIVARGDMLKCGNTKSCGCQKIDAATRHGHSHSRPGKPPSSTYNSWQAMRERCLNPTNHNYPRYGGAGVRICDRWMVFENFLADMGERPAGTTLDRYPNRDGNYEPGNCRWASPKQQANNRKRTATITYQDVTRTVTEWAELHGIPAQKIRNRLRYMPGEKILEALIPKNQSKALTA